ncbi:threonine/homoserine/homoserine lactone efflux protein [Erythromicrobium ramosum]|uniref:Threonine/homoserine/homoserine lactone efflux protein n=1 Tax=Erythrobacter ramosus TaxID=35811 RepID=A0ABR6HXF3_9SPHN|nr:threonine/homoserine/homoserine lactone efflux protein [Erythrobacter ramosus]
MIDLAGFALAVLLIELTPGPNMGWLVTLTLAEGRRAGLGAIIGIALGLSANAALSVLAASIILAQGPALSQAVSLLAAAMMAWLAWEAWRDSGESSPTATPRNANQRHALAGFAINLLNPKSALFFITVMPQFIPGGQPRFVQGLTMAAISVSIATAIHLALVFGAEQARGVLMAKARAQVVRRVLAIAMLAVAAWFVAKALG